MMSLRGVRTSLGVASAPTVGDQVVAFLIRWAILSIAVWVAATVIEGIRLDGWESVVVVALILGLLNATVRPVLLMVSLPVTILTLGLFLLVLNTAMLAAAAWIAGEIERVHFAIDGFGAAFFGALIITVVSWVFGWFLTPSRGKGL